MREDDELAQQAEREHLHPQHQQERREQQGGTVGERLAEQQPIQTEIRDQHRADAERRSTEHAEEAQRLLGEAHQEEDAEQIEQVMHVLARPIDAAVAVLRRLPHRHLVDAEAEPHREDRQEAMLIAVQIDLFQHLAMHRAYAATEIAQARAGDEVDETVECRAPHAVERVAIARPPIADRHIGGAQPCEQLANVARLDLWIGGQRDDRAAARALEAGGERCSFAEVARQVDDREFLAFAQQRLQRAPRLRSRPVEHEDELVRGSRRCDSRPIFAIERPDVGSATGADRHDDGDRRRYGVGLHGGL